MEELEGLRLRATGINEKTQDILEKTKTKLDLHDKSRSRISNWHDTADKYLERRNQELLKRLEDEEIEKRKLDQEEFEIQQAKRDNLMQKALKQQYATID